MLKSVTDWRLSGRAVRRAAGLIGVPPLQGTRQRHADASSCSGLQALDRDVERQIRSLHCPDTPGMVPGRLPTGPSGIGALRTANRPSVSAGSVGGSINLEHCRSWARASERGRAMKNVQPAQYCGRIASNSLPARPARVAERRLARMRGVGGRSGAQAQPLHCSELRRRFLSPAIRAARPPVTRTGSSSGDAAHDRAA